MIYIQKTNAYGIEHYRVLAPILPIKDEVVTYQIHCFMSIAGANAFIKARFSGFTVKYIGT